MYALDIEQRTNASMAVAVILTPWADLYDLSSGLFFMQMREQAPSAIVLYEWSTADGDIVYSETRANGWIEFTTNPIEGSYITLGTTQITFMNTVATDSEYEVRIGEDLTHTLINLLEYLNNSTDEHCILCTYSAVSSDTLVITYGTAGTLGNAFTINSNVGGATTSGDTLTGGGGMLMILAPVSEIETFSGEYVYDCRFQIPATDELFYTTLFGGILTFVQGITRDTD